MAKILVVGGVKGWSMDRVCRGIQIHSKHDLEITNYWIGGFTPSEWDGIYIHSGAVMSGKAKQYILDHRKDTKWAVGIRGPTAFRRNYHRLDSKLWDSFSCGSKVWMEEVEKNSKTLDIQGYVCYGGIDLSVFSVQPFPEEFTIGWAGQAGNGAKRFKRFYELPFNKKMVGGGAKWRADFLPRRQYPLMNDFYAECSVYVSTAYKEGGPLPIKEAAACGRPVVCTRTGDALEWVPQEYMVDTEKREYDRDRMIEIITQFKDDPALLEREGKRFKKLSKRWDFSVVVKNYDEMFDEMLNV